MRDMLIRLINLYGTIIIINIKNPNSDTRLNIKQKASKKNHVNEDF
jgi:hypothetical protein